MLFTEDCASFLVYRRELGHYIITPREVAAVEGSSVCDRKAKEKEKRPSSGTSASSVNTTMVEPCSHRERQRDIVVTGSQADEERIIGASAPMMKEL